VLRPGRDPAGSDVKIEVGRPGRVEAEKILAI
jgi:hypothetical protein